jgi:hypothetical protein
MRAILVILATARLDWDFDFVVTRVLDGEQDASIRFVGEQLQQPGVLNVRLGKGQSTVSDGARAGHGHASRNASCRSGPAKLPTKSRSVSGTS